MTKILIIGGCGFIGSNFVEYLLENTEWKINVLDNLCNGSLSNVEKLKNFTKRVKFFEGDIINISDISNSIGNCEYIVNFAAQTSVIDSINDPFYDENINIKGLLNILKIAVDNKIKKLVQISSAAALGTQEMPIHELQLPKPISPYGASKLAGEAYCSAFSSSYGIDCIVLRCSNVYGPKSYNKGSVIAKFIKQIIKNEDLEIFGDGNQTRDFIYVEDVCKGIYQSIISNISGFELFQLGSGIETSINSLIQLLFKLIENKSMRLPKIRFIARKEGEIIKSYTESKKATEKLGFFVNYDLNKGLKITLDWFLNDNQ